MIVPFPKRGEPTNLDPVYAAIKRHRAAWAEFGEKCCALDDDGSPEARAEWDRLNDAVGEAGQEIKRPTTIAGASAALRYVAESDQFGDRTKFMQIIADALEKIAT